MYFNHESSEDSHEMFFFSSENISDSVIFNFTNFTYESNHGNSYLKIQNHHVGNFTARGFKSRIILKNVMFDVCDIWVNIGYIDIEIAPEVTYAKVSTTQPYGAICMASQEVSLYSASSGCPDEAERQKPNKIINQQVEATASCTISALLCNVEEDSNQCSSAYESLVEQEIVTEVIDGFIEVVHKIDDERIWNYENINYRNIYPTFNVESYMNLYAMNETLMANPGLDYMFIYEVMGPQVEDIWVYITRKSYLEARVWPLTAVSLSLIRPLTKRTSLTIGDTACPSRL